MRRKVETDVLVRLYCDEHFSLKDISEAVDLTKSNVRNRLVAAGCKMREPMKRGWSNPKNAPTRTPTRDDIAWAAGVYEGEGCVLMTVSEYGLRKPIVSLVQKDDWLCRQLRDLFGGTVNVYRKRDGRAFNYWRLTGVASVGFFLMIYKFLSPRRQQQIMDAFEKSGLARPTAKVA